MQISIPYDLPFPWATTIAINTNTLKSQLHESGTFCYSGTRSFHNKLTQRYLTAHINTENFDARLLYLQFHAFSKTELLNLQVSTKGWVAMLFGVDRHYPLE